MSLQFIMATYQSCVQVRQQVGWHPKCSDKSLCVYWGIFVKILSPQDNFPHSKSHKFCHSDLILGDLLQGQNSIAETDLHKNSPVHEAICHGNLLSQCAAANCCQVCSTFKSFGAPSRHPLTWLYTVTMYVEMLKLHELAASTLMELNDFAENWTERQFSRQIMPGMGIKLLLKAMLIHKHKGIENKENVQLT